MIPLQLSTGEPATLLGATDAEFKLLSPRAFAPGAPLEASAELEGAPLSLKLKCFGSRRTEAGFEVRGRAISLTRGDRERILRALVG